MKANELMIGDYVTFKDSIECDNIPMKVKIVALGYQHRGEEDEALVQIDDDDTCDIINIDNEVVGYPLTTEILEKNGFEVQEQGGGRKDLWTGFGIDCEGDIEIEFQDNIPIHLKIDGAFKGEYYTSTNITYIHELQHALRLCGIEKEIEL